VLHYFERLMQSPPVGAITIKRKVLEPPFTVSDWQKSALPLCRVTVHEEGGIEDTKDMLEADFANEYIGGGVLHGGNVQEEIRFLLSPECMVTMLMCPKMEETEALLIEGTERFNRHSGYGGSLDWAADYVDEQTEDGQPLTKIVAFDALVMIGRPQFDDPSKLRELNKAFIAFQKGPDEAVPLQPIATGHWGCGMFRGDKGLKMALQWLAASQAQRDMHYFIFADKCLGEAMENVISVMQNDGSEPWTVGKLAQIVFSEEAHDEDLQGRFLPFLRTKMASLSTGAWA
jgi:poly(ADP-ribose) glycohydrolase